MVSGSDTIIANIEAYKEKLRLGAFDGMDEVGKFFVTAAQEALRTNGSIITGRLLTSIAYDGPNEIAPGVLRVVAGPLRAAFDEVGVEYGKFVEYGRGPIKPTTKKVLHWINPENGKDVFATYVKAAPPKPFMMPALQLTGQYMNDILLEFIGI